MLQVKWDKPVRLIFKERTLQERVSCKGVHIEASRYKTLQRFVPILYIVHEG